MFNNMKLGQKIIVGFASLIFIALILGTVAVWNMKSTSRNANLLAQEFVPEVKIANDIERFSLLTMYQIRGYNFTEDDNYLEKGKEYLEQVKTNLQKASSLAEQSKYLEDLKKNVVTAINNVNEYERLLNETSAGFQVLKTKRTDIETSAEKSLAICHKILENKKDVRLFTLIDDIGDMELDIIIASWKFQTLRDTKIAENAMSKFDLIAQNIEKIKVLIKSPVDIKMVDELANAVQTHKADLSGFIETWNNIQKLNMTRGQAAENVLTAAQETAAKGIEQTSDISTKANTSLSFSSSVMLIGLIIAIIVGFLLAMFITRSITASIHNVINGLTEGSDQVAAAATQVSASSQQLAEGSSEQASSLEEISSSLEEMTSMTKQNSETAKQADIMSHTAQSSAQKGADAMIRMSDAINKIKYSSDETAKIIKTIDEIAFQTNLLALNAAVEAARAGEAGLGFAVVAEEVRNLAQRSADAAKNTSSLIEEAQTNADNGVLVSKEVGTILKEIADAATKVTQLISEVATASNEQFQGINQLNAAVGQMDKVTQASAANAEESASASEQLSSQAYELQNLVELLVDMVGKTETHGISKQNPTQYRKKQKPLDTDKMKYLQAPPKTNIKTANRSMKKNTVIPLDDDFENF